MARKRFVRCTENPPRFLTEFDLREVVASSLGPLVPSITIVSFQSMSLVSLFMF